MTPLGYSKINESSQMLYMSINNQGLTDQMMKDFKLKFGEGVHVLTQDAGSKKADEDHYVVINGLKRRDEAIVAVPVSVDLKEHISHSCKLIGCDDITLEMHKPEIQNFFNQYGDKEDIDFRLLNAGELSNINLNLLKQKFMGL